MSKPKWTEEQHAAITLRGQILVAAAAGSGKTAVLVERLIQRITDPEEPEDVEQKEFPTIAIVNSSLLQKAIAGITPK